jgi:ion transport 2 domain protein
VVSLIDKKYKLIYEIIFTLLAIIAAIITLLDLTETINLSTNITLHTLDTAIFYIFIFDYVTRLIISRDKKYFFKNNIPDLIAIIPFNSLFKVFRIAKLIRLASMTKLLKLARFVGVFVRLNKKIKGVLKTNGLNHALWFTLIIILLSAIGIYVAEPHTVRTFENALWWSFVTATTVGYGDIFPTSKIGRIIAGVLMLTGIGTIGMITGSISTYFMSRQNSTKEHNDISEIIKQSKNLKTQEIDEILNYINYVKTKRKNR